MTSGNPYPDGAPVLVEYPQTEAEEKAGRESWPWLPGTIMSRCGPDERQACVEARELTVREDGSKPRRNTPPHKLFYPCCFRGSSEITRAPREP